MAKGTEVTKPASTAVVSWQAALQKSAAKLVKAAAVIGSSNNISFRGGVLSIGGGTVVDNSTEVVVLAIMHERAFYTGQYNADEPRSPTCYAYGIVNEGLPVEPHESVVEMQSEVCKGCPNAEWGSAPTGRGQLCRQYIKIACISAPTKAKAEEIAALEIYYGRIPPTSLRNIKTWLDWIGVQDSASTFAWVSSLKVLPSSKNVFDVHLGGVREIPREWQGAVIAKATEAETAIAAPYPDFTEEQAAPAKKAARPAGKKF